MTGTTFEIFGCTVSVCERCETPMFGVNDYCNQCKKMSEYDYLAEPEVTTTIELTESQRAYLREEVDGKSAKASLQTLIDAYEGKQELSEDRVRELVREEVRMEALK